MAAQKTSNVFTPLFRAQRAHITEHLPDLVENTIVEIPTLTFLRSRDVLGDFDIESLTTIGNSFVRSSELYKLIQSRPGSYEVLIEALEKTHQFGVSQLLKEVYDKPETEETETIDSPKKYSQVPIELERFLKGDTESICIVRTLDAKITCDKIRENVDNCHLELFEDFLKCISTRNSSFDDDLRLIHVVTDSSMQNLKLIMRNPQIQQSAIGKLIVVIHCNSEEDLQEVEQPPSTLELMPHVCIDKIEFGDLSPAFMYEMTKRLEEEFKIDLEHHPQLNLDRMMCGKLLVDLINGDGLLLYKCTLPEELSYYVERTLLTRNSISPDIFDRTPSDDVYLVTGVGRHELVGLVPRYRTGNSSSQLLQRSLTVHFMTMDRPDHFERICEKTCGDPVHLFHYDGTTLRWIKSRGEMTSVQQCIQKCQDNLNNDQFMDMLKKQEEDNPNMPVCISDSPGMGKSVLLEEIGRKLTKHYPDRAIIFVVINEFINQVKQNWFEGKELGIETAMQNLICKNELGKVIMKTKLSSELVTTELLLDGFDEVPSADMDLTYEILQIIKTSFKSIRLWITSRPHLLMEVENRLSVLGYKMKPFSEGDQLRFLTKFWSRRDDQLEKDKLKEFAQICLDNLKSSEMSSEQDIAGIPLQCLLIGEIYEEEAVNYALYSGSDQSQRSSFPPAPNPISSITNLYQRLIQNRLRKYITTYGSSAMDPTELMEVHIRLSLELLFKHSLEEFDEPVPLEEVLKVGLLESSSTVKYPRFLHRTFAEYFVAWLMVDWLVGGKLRNELSDICNSKDPLPQPGFGKETAAITTPNSGGTKSNKFVHNVICYFLNSLLAEIDQQEHPLSLPNNSQQMFETMFRSAKNIAYACAIQDFIYIFKVLEEMKGFETQARDIFDEEFLLITIEHSCLELVKMAFEHFESYKQWESDLNLQTKALRVAVRRGDLSIVEFLIKDKGLREIVQGLSGDTRKLLHDCVGNTLLQLAPQLEQKLTVIRMLIGISPELLNGKDDEGRTPLLCYDVHVQLLTQLVEMGADVLAEDNYGATVLQYPLFGRYYTSEDYHTLITSIPEDKLEELVKVRNPLWRIAERINPKPETLEYLHDLGVDFNSINRYGYSILASAVKYRRDSRTIKKLIDLRADIDWRGKRGQSLLHVSAGYGNVGGIGFLIQQGMPVNIKDDYDLTPLDYSIKGEKIGMRYETGMELISLGGTFKKRINAEGQNLLHIAAKHGNMDSVQLLLKLGYDVNAEDNNGNTPLHLSVVGSEFSFYAFDTVMILLEHDDINPNAPNKNFEIPLHYGLLYGRHFNLRTYQLLKSRTEVEWSPLLAITAFKFLMYKFEDLDGKEFKEIAQEYVDLGANLDYQDEQGNSLLHQVAFENNERAVKYLVQQGMDVNARNRMLETPLHRAVFGQDKEICLEIIKYLIQCGTVVSARDEEGRTFLHKFPENISPTQFHDMAEYLIERKHANMFNAVCEEYECTPFQKAVFHVELEEKTLALLHSNGVDFNAVDKHGSSVLCYAVRGYRSVKCLSILVSLGADLRNLNNNGNSLLDIAGIWGNVDALEFFLEQGGLDVNGVDRDGDTALHTVLLDGRKNVWEMSQLLVKKGTDVNIVNGSGLTPLEIAMKRVKDKQLREKLMEILDG